MCDLMIRGRKSRRTEDRSTTAPSHAVMPNKPACGALRIIYFRPISGEGQCRARTTPAIDLVLGCGTHCRVGMLAADHPTRVARNRSTVIHPRVYRARYSTYSVMIKLHTGMTLHPLRHPQWPCSSAVAANSAMDLPAEASFPTVTRPRQRLRDLPPSLQNCCIPLRRPARVVGC